MVDELGVGGVRAPVCPIREVAATDGNGIPRLKKRGDFPLSLPGSGRCNAIAFFGSVQRRANSLLLGSRELSAE